MLALSAKNEERLATERAIFARGPGKLDPPASDRAGRVTAEVGMYAKHC